MLRFRIYAGYGRPGVKTETINKGIGDLGWGSGRRERLRGLSDEDSGRDWLVENMGLSDPDILWKRRGTQRSIRNGEKENLELISRDLIELPDLASICGKIFRRVCQKRVGERKLLSGKRDVWGTAL